MLLKQFLKEEENKSSKTLLGVIKKTDTFVPYLKRVGRKAFGTKTFDAFDANEKYQNGNKETITGKQIPQDMYFKVYIDGDKGEIVGRKVKIDDYSAIKKVELLDKNGHWRNVPLPSEDLHLSPEADTKLRMSSARKVYDERSKK